MTQTQKALRLTNEQVMNLRGWLDTPLHGEDNRTRNKIYKTLLDQVSIIEKDRLEILKRLAEKDDKGEPKMKDQMNPLTGRIEKVYDLTPDNLKKFDDEWIKIKEDEFVIDILESNKKLIPAVKTLLVENIGKHRDFSAAEGQIFETIITAFEKI